MTFIPWGPIAGKICPSSMCSSVPSRPIILGTFGPVISISINPTFFPILPEKVRYLWLRWFFRHLRFPERTMILCLIVSLIFDILIFFASAGRPAPSELSDSSLLPLAGRFGRMMRHWGICHDPWQRWRYFNAIQTKLVTDFYVGSS